MDEDKQPHAQATQNDYAGYRNFSRKNSSAQSVSYTHLDVYKRQHLSSV